MLISKQIRAIPPSRLIFPSNPAISIILPANPDPERYFGERDFLSLFFQRMAIKIPALPNISDRKKMFHLK